MIKDHAFSLNASLSQQYARLLLIIAFPYNQQQKQPKPLPENKRKYKYSFAAVWKTSTLEPNRDWNQRQTIKEFKEML